MKGGIWKEKLNLYPPFQVHLKYFIGISFLVNRGKNAESSVSIENIWVA